MLLAPCSAKLSAQSPPCSRNASPAATRAERLHQVARLTCKNQRRKGRKLPLDLGKRLLVRVVGHLQGRLLAPALGRPTLGHDAAPPIRLLRNYRAGKMSDFSGLYTTAGAKARINPHRT